jgi:hypothetical protein
VTGRAAQGAGVDGTAAPVGEASGDVTVPTPEPTPAPAPAAPPSPTSRRSARTARRRHARTRTVVAAATSTLLVAAVALAGVQLHTSRQRAAEAAERAEAIGLAADVAAEDAKFLSAQDRLAQADAGSRALAREAAIQAERAAAAEAARAAEEAAAAEAARVAQEEEADAAARASAPSGSAASSSGSRIAGWVDGRPVDAAGNVLWVTSVPTADGDGSNGRMPMSSMCLVPWGTDQLGFAQYLRCDAADALTALNQAFTARFGAAIDMDLTYRSYEDQVAMKAAFGGLAATPGTSSHGTGTALDVQEWAVYAFGSERYTWLVENGPTYGWYAPARVREGQPYAEYWHFEYGPGRTS